MQLITVLETLKTRLNDEIATAHRAMEGGMEYPEYLKLAGRIQATRKIINVIDDAMKAYHEEA
jgi:hypothetical protein